MGNAETHMWYHHYRCHPIPWVLEGRVRVQRCSIRPSTSPTPSWGCLQHPRAPHGAVGHARVK